MGQVACHPFFHANESLSSLAGTLLVTIARAATTVNVMFPLAAGHRVHEENGRLRASPLLNVEQDNWLSAPNDEVLGDKLEPAAPALSRLGGTANELDVTYFVAALARLQNVAARAKRLAFSRFGR